VTNARSAATDSSDVQGVRIADDQQVRHLLEDRALPASSGQVSPNGARRRQADAPEATLQGLRRTDDLQDRYLQPHRPMPQ